MNPKRTISYFVFILLVSLCYNANAQKLFNKDIKALIKIKKNSEFVTFTATAENLNASNYSLSYEFMTFKNDVNGNVSKSSQSNRFYLEGNNTKILSSTTVNNNIEGSITLVLLIYPLQTGEEKPGAIGKDRIVITSNENGTLNINSNRPKQVKKVSKDQGTLGKDGVFFEGLIIQKAITKSGRDFYRYFYQEYLNKNLKSDKNIIIKEVPGQRRNTRISVTIGNQVVWQFFARPKKEFLKEMASVSVKRCNRYLQILKQRNESITRY